MDFTALQEQLRSSFFLFCLACISCQSSMTDESSLQLFNADNINIQNKNGIIYLNEQPFSGKVFQLSPLTKDTVELIGYLNGKEHGEWRHYYPNKQIEEIRYYDNGDKIKTLTRWWENGQKQFFCTFKDGEYDGALTEWNRDGQVVRAMHYKNGYEKKNKKAYYNNGKVRSNYVIINGKRRGLLGTKNCVNVSDSIFKK